MKTYSPIIMLLTFCTVVFPALALPAQEVQSDKERAEIVLELATEKASHLEFYLGADQKTKMTLHPRSLLRWSNPVTTALYGEVFIWTAKGRPEVIVSMHKFFQPNRRHMTGEFHSLARGPITARQDKQTFWACQEPGITLKPLAGSTKVGTNAPQRLRQMRTLARHFSAEASARSDLNKREKLRLLPKPIYRYESTDPTVLDGAVFAFVQGTNPEVVLLLEARRSGTEHEWQYALARFNSVALRASYYEQQVWSVPQAAPPWNNVKDPGKPYFIFMLDRGE